MYLEVLSEGLERVLMVHGSGKEVITMYEWWHINEPHWLHIVPAFSVTKQELYTTFVVGLVAIWQFYAAICLVVTHCSSTSTGIAT